MFTCAQIGKAEKQILQTLQAQQSDGDWVRYLTENFLELLFLEYLVPFKTSQSENIIVKFRAFGMTNEDLPENSERRHVVVLYLPT